MTMLDPRKFLHVAGKRKSDSSQIWAVGGSALVDSNIAEEQRFGNIIANTLNLPVTYLAGQGVSNDWCADQILRSDIRSGDIVLWNIMFEPRFPFWHSPTNQVIHVQQQYKKFNKIEIDLSDHAVTDWLASEHCFYSSVTHVYQVKNFCEKIGAKLLTYVHYPAGISKEMLEYMSGFPAFTVMSGAEFLDITSDGWHPGPRQHQQYAELLLQALKEQGWK